MARGRVLGQIIGQAAGDVVSSGFSAVKGLAGSVAGAARGLANLENEKIDVAQQKTSTGNVIYVNFGMAGSAGRQKVTGGGTLPQPKAVKASGVNQNMPTDKLLNVAIKQLTSINSTLKKQLEFDKRVYDQAVAAEREAAVESSTNSFSGIKDRLSGLVDTQGAADRAKGLLSGKTLLAGLGLLGAGSLIAGSLDNSELEKLNKNVEQFKKDYKWLFDLSASIGTGVLSGGFIGYILGGLKGIIPGMVIGTVAEYFGISPVKAVAGGYAAYRVGKTGFDIFKRTAKIQKIQTTTSQKAINTMRAAGGKKAIGTTGGWLTGPIGKRFLAFIERKKGKIFLKSIIKLLARVTAGLGITATGVGVIPGLLWTGFSVVLAFSDVKDIIDLWYEFQDEEALKKDAESVVAEGNQPDATQAAAPGIAATLDSSRIASKSGTGSPEKAQAFFESRGWSPEQAAGIVGNLAVESGFNPGAVGDGGDAYGLAQWNKRYSPDRVANFERVMGTSLYNSDFDQQLQFIDWELRNTHKKAGNLLSQASTPAEAATIVDKYYEVSDGSARAKRISNANAALAGDFGKVTTGGATGYSGAGGASALGGGAMAFTEDAARLLGGVAGQLVGKTTLKSVSTPLPVGPDKSREIGQKSTELDNIIKFGDLKSKQKALATPTAPTVALQAASPSGTISVIDPNWHGLGDPRNTLNKYLANFKMAS